MTDFDESWGFATLGVRAFEPARGSGEHSAAIHPTSSFVFKTAAEAAAVFAGEAPGNVYSRFTNPTVQGFEQRLAAMEGGAACVATASGMAAILSLCLATLRSGDEVVASRSLFGATVNLFNNVLSRFGIVTTWVNLTELDAWRAAITPRTKLLFVETPSNPLSEVADIAALAELAHAHGAKLAVDNCFLTPVLQQPLKLGADYVIHSATKYLDGQGRCLGGAVVGDAQSVGKDVYGFMRTAGPSMSPFNAWVFLKGLETLALRMRAHEANAMALARWLCEQPRIARVHYSGLESHPGHALACRQQRGFGGVLSFELRGGRGEAWKLIDATRLCSITANLGDTRTTITHPATTTHGRVTPEARAAAGIGEGLVRVAVGLEDIEDVIADLARALA
ncbi:MAG: O-succinylhomoserine sulfhydrylase [Stagnimonas sp.]|nr:O-succinylhomoserine sulfhydrylase [Stagnimonas sp.]